MPCGRGQEGSKRSQSAKRGKNGIAAVVRSAISHVEGGSAFGRKGTALLYPYDSTYGAKGDDRVAPTIVPPVCTASARATGF